MNLKERNFSAMKKLHSPAFVLIILILLALLVSPVSTAALTTSPSTVLTMKRGESVMLTAPSFDNEPLWSSSDPSKASVTCYGLVTAHSSGSTTITASGISGGVDQIVSWSVSVSSSPVFASGTYIIESSNRLYALTVEGPSLSNNAKVIASQLDGVNYQKWQFIQSSDGYYRLSSVYSGRCIRVSNDSPNSGADIIQYQSNGASGMKWSFLRNSSGKYILIPESSVSEYLVLGVPAWSGNNYARTVSPGSASSGNYEWTITRCLPTNGDETSFDQYWGGGNSSCYNCFQYVLNCQSRPWNHSSPWIFLQPGDYSHTSTSGYNTTPSLLVEAVEADFAAFDNDYGPGYIFEPIGRYEECPEGSIKVALVISSSDYHWYKQDADGLWSHKQGVYSVSRYDQSGHLIIDPQTADRGSYTLFVGYYALTPWNCRYSQNSSSSSFIGGELEYIMFHMPSSSYCGRPVFFYDLDDGGKLRWETDTGLFFIINNECETQIPVQQGFDILYRLYDKEMALKSKE